MIKSECIKGLYHCTDSYPVIQYQISSTMHTLLYHTITYIIKSHQPYHSAPYHTITYRTIPHHTILSNTMPYPTVPYHTMPYHTTPYRTISQHTIPYNTPPYHSVPCIPYHAVPYYIIPYHSIPCHTIYHTILSHTVPTQHHTIPYFSLISLIIMFPFRELIISRTLGSKVIIQCLQYNPTGNLIGKKFVDIVLYNSTVQLDYISYEIPSYAWIKPSYEKFHSN